MNSQKNENPKMFLFTLSGVGVRRTFFSVFSHSVSLGLLNFFLSLGILRAENIFIEIEWKVITVKMVTVIFQKYSECGSLTPIQISCPFGIWSM